MSLKSQDDLQLLKRKDNTNNTNKTNDSLLVQGLSTNLKTTIDTITITKNETKEIETKKEQKIILVETSIEKFEKAQVKYDAESIVNGYEMIDVNDQSNVLSFEEFQECVLVKELKTEWTLEKWKQAMETQCCTDWYKMDDHGESFGGVYYSSPHNSENYQNAFQLTFDANCLAMWKLPFSKDLLLYTIHLGCCLRLESVRFSNFICEWINLKQKAIDELNFPRQETVVSLK
jgi:hypothetical protein